MANIINRFRRRKASLQNPSPSAEPVYVDEKNVAIPSENGTATSEPAINSSEPKHNQNYDPELATDPSTSEDGPVIEEDLRDIPLVVRNTVSFEDDLNLPTITFRYFLLTFIFIAPGAFLYQMVSQTPN
jgi:hypothetical protein